MLLRTMYSTIDRSIRIVLLNSAAGRLVHPLERNKRIFGYAHVRCFTYVNIQREIDGQLTYWYRGLASQNTLEIGRDPATGARVSHPPLTTRPQEAHKAGVTVVTGATRDTRVVEFTSERREDRWTSPPESTKS